MAQSRCSDYASLSNARRMMHLRVMNPFAIPLALNWRERGLWAYLTEHGPTSFEDLMRAGDIGKEGLRHLIKSLKKKGIMEIPRIRDGKNRFTSSKYQLTDLGKGLVAPLAVGDKPNLKTLRRDWDDYLETIYPEPEVDGEDDAA